MNTLTQACRLPAAARLAQARRPFYKNMVERMDLAAIGAIPGIVILVVGAVSMDMPDSAYSLLMGGALMGARKYWLQRRDHYGRVCANLQLVADLPHARNADLLTLAERDAPEFPAAFVGEDVGGGVPPPSNPPEGAGRPSSPSPT